MLHANFFYIRLSPPPMDSRNLCGDENSVMRWLLLARNRICDEGGSGSPKLLERNRISDKVTPTHGLRARGVGARIVFRGSR
ncbi:hypothetical protein EVAR_47744_1 [Eumeta japonica]|uniref:Uncharacterized protein n=1 Tax=Eumeta variegata TaxID=151549 RepID=A0A4C1VW67_EUMVA|nr:hypothetical protein EVAR_47744_1 [Eumeta japonica]